MTTLSDEDVDRIADALVTRIKATKHDFWIDPEQHYKDHSDLRALVEALNSDTLTEMRGAARAFATVKRAFATLLIGLIAVGAMVLAFGGFANKVKGP